MSPDRPLRIAINGFGRIGRLVLRALLDLEAPVDVVAVNDLTEPATMAHLFEHDSVHGRYPGEVALEGDELVVSGDRLQLLREEDPSKLPWAALEVDYVVEATGRFRTPEDMAKHRAAGASRVILSAPAKGRIDATVVLGVNDEVYDPAEHHLVSNASCTTNCLAPTLKVLHEAFGVEHAVMTTVHAYTTSQNLLDAPHSDLRRGRAAAMSMLPTTTGAARAIGLVMPELDGRVDGMAIRVPTPNVSLVDLTARLEQGVEAEAVIAAYRSAAEGDLEGILRVEDRELVSVDLNGDPHSAIIDAPSLMVVDDSLAKVLAWYDNEVGYATRTAELAAEMWAREPT